MKMIFQTSMIMFHVNLQGCKHIRFDSIWLLFWSLDVLTSSQAQRSCGQSLQKLSKKIRRAGHRAICTGLCRKAFLKEFHLERPCRCGGLNMSKSHRMNVEIYCLLMVIFFLVGVLVEISPSVFGRWLGFQFWFALKPSLVRSSSQRWLALDGETPKPRPFLELGCKAQKNPSNESETRIERIPLKKLTGQRCFSIFGWLECAFAAKVVVLSFPAWASWRLKILQTIRGCEAQIGVPYNGCLYCQ